MYYNTLFLYGPLLYEHTQTLLNIRLLGIVNIYKFLQCSSRFYITKTKCTNVVYWYKKYINLFKVYLPFGNIWINVGTMNYHPLDLRLIFQTKLYYKTNIIIIIVCQLLSEFPDSRIECIPLPSKTYPGMTVPQDRIRSFLHFVNDFYRGLFGFKSNLTDFLTIFWPIYLPSSAHSHLIFLNLLFQSQYFPILARSLENAVKN